MRTRLTVGLMVLALIVSTTPVQANDNFINGYFMTAMSVSSVKNAGYDGMSGGLRVEGETPGRWSLFASFTGSEGAKYGLGDLRQLDYRLAGKVKITEKFAVGLGYRQTDMQFLEIAGEREDESIFIPASYDLSESIRLNGELHLPDDSKYKTRSLILGLQQFLQIKGKWDFYYGVAFDGAQYEAINSKTGKMETEFSPGARILFGTGRKGIGHGGTFQTARK